MCVYVYVVDKDGDDRYDYCWLIYRYTVSFLSNRKVERNITRHGLRDTFVTTVGRKNVAKLHLHLLL